jgi:hypothetical protein
LISDFILKKGAEIEKLLMEKTGRIFWNRALILPSLRLLESILEDLLIPLLDLFLLQVQAHNMGN